MARFSIIIIHRNNPERIVNLIKNIFKYKSSNDEVILVDNNSEDCSIESVLDICESHKIKIIRNHCNAGYGYSCNQGIRQASGKYFLLCNNDIFIKQNTLDQFEKFMEKDEFVGLIGPQMFFPNGNKIKSYGTSKPSIWTQLDLIGRPIRQEKIKEFSHVSTLRGACLCVRRKMTLEVGIYDEDFYFYHEEREWCHRINSSDKWKVMFAPEIEISHVAGGSTRKVFKESRIEFFRSRLLFWKKIFNTQEILILWLWNIPKLFVDMILYTSLSILTLSLNKKYKEKMIDRFIVILWLLMFMPKSWGLPNKCS